MTTDRFKSHPYSLWPKSKDGFLFLASIFNIWEKDEDWPEYSIISSVIFEEHEEDSFLS